MAALDLDEPVVTTLAVVADGERIRRVIHYFDTHEDQDVWTFLSGTETSDAAELVRFKHLLEVDPSVETIRRLRPGRVWRSLVRQTCPGTNFSSGTRGIRATR